MVIARLSVVVMPTKCKNRNGMKRVQRIQRVALSGFSVSAKRNENKNKKLLGNME